MRIPKIAIIGANGQLASDIIEVFNNSYQIIPLTHKDIDITNLDKTKNVLEEIKPNIIINTAAYHKVDEVEDNPEKAFLVNSTAQKNLAELANIHKWILVYVSTDYVFGLNNQRKQPYTESDNTGPINVYGVSKLAGENFTRYICDKYFIIRVCGLFGKAGSSGKGGNFVELMIKLAKEKGAVKVVNDQILTPTYTKNIAQNLLALLKTNNYGLYHMTSEGHCSWWEFANEIFNQLRLKVKNTPVDSNFYKTRAKRPNYSVLENKNLKKIGLNKMHYWKENLNLYLKEKGYLN